MRMTLATAAAATLVLGTAAARADPDCAGPGRWPATMTMVELRNAGAIAADRIDPAGTTSTQIASQKIGADLYRQVFRVDLRLKDGGRIETITVSDASSDECSMAPVTVYRVVPPAK